jgi:hypothetical protein
VRLPQEQLDSEWSNPSWVNLDGNAAISLFPALRHHPGVSWFRAGAGIKWVRRFLAGFEGNDVEEVIKYALNNVIGGVALVIIFVLWVRGVLVRNDDANLRVKELRESQSQQLEVIQKAHEQRIESIKENNADVLTALNLAHDNRVKALQSRLEAVIADRDAWREAHRVEVGARQSAEKATSQLMESSNVSMALLAALKDALAPTRSGD